MIKNQYDPSFLSPLQSKAVLTFEFITIRRVLSNREIPFQALSENPNIKFTTVENCCHSCKKDWPSYFYKGAVVCDIVNQQML